MKERARRSRSTLVFGNTQVVRAEAPLAELYDYSSALRSLSHGRGIHSRKFSHYEEVPREVFDTIIAEHKSKVEAQS